MKEQNSIRYPIGPFVWGKTYTTEETRENVLALAKFPRKLKKMLRKLHRVQIDTPYRLGGWTIRQLVHHLADVHLYAYASMKMALSEPAASIKPIESNIWADMDDSRYAPVKMSVQLLSALHRRWIFLVENLSEEDLEKQYFHQGLNRTITVAESLALLAWHAQHHLEHIKIARANMLALELYDASKTDVDAVSIKKVSKRAGRPKRADQPSVVEAVAVKRAGRPKRTEQPSTVEAVAVKRAGRPKRADQPAVVEAVAVKRAGRPKRADQPMVSRDKAVSADNSQSKAPRKGRVKAVVPKKD